MGNGDYLTDANIEAGAPIVLVGFMCSGKTTLGRAVAQRIGSDFIDLDLIIEETEGRTINHIFAEEGEDGFRLIEARTLQEVLKQNASKPIVLALGGGTPCRPGCMETVNAVSFATVWLQTDRERLIDRLEKGADSRPLMAGKTRFEISETAQSMLAVREPFYAQATHRFDSSQLESADEIERSVERFVNEILKGHNHS